MKFCILILLFVVTLVRGDPEAPPLACVDNYNNLATELSNRVSPEIRANLVKAIQTLINSKSCILQGDIECAGDTIFVDAVSETKNAIQLSTGPLQQLFYHFEGLNAEALRQIQALVGVQNATQQVISAVCTMYNERSKLILEYFAQNPAS